MAPSRRRRRWIRPTCPFAWVPALQAAAAASNTDLLGPADDRHLPGFPRLRVHLDRDVGGAADRREPRAHVQAFMDAYWAAQRRAGRFPRPLNNRLTNVGQWLKVNEVVEQRQPHPVAARLRLPRRLPDQHGRHPARRNSSAARPITGRAARARREPPPDLHAAHRRGRPWCRSPAALLGLALGAVGLRAVQAHLRAGQHFGGSGYLAAHFDPAERRVGAGARRAVDACRRPLSRPGAIGRLPPAGYLKSRELRDPSSPELANMNLNVRPVLSALLRNRTGAILVALQIAIALAVMVNAAWIVAQRIAADRGADRHRCRATLFAIGVAALTSHFDLARRAARGPRLPAQPAGSRRRHARASRSP